MNIPIRLLPRKKSHNGKTGAVAQIQAETTPLRRDALTGLLSHSAFQMELERKFASARENGLHLACMLLNIDYFHAINRRYGYPFGDAILRELGELLRSGLNQGEIAARYSGEEFGLVWLTPETRLAIDRAEAIRRAIADHKFIAEARETFLTASCGLAVSDAKIRSASELLSFAKLVLKTAKREGRNRVCYWEKPAAPEPEQPQEGLIAELQEKFADIERELRAYGNNEVKSLLDEIEIPDGLAEDHAENVAFIAASIADELNMSAEQIDTLISAALLHDIGKAGIDSEILSKESPLTPEEFEQIKKHPNLGVEFLQETQFFEKELPMILHHHERFDGKGYPDGLAGEAIPLGARIIGLAETIDGLLSGSVYRKPCTIAETIRELQRCAGTQFDPKLVQVAVKLLETGRIG